jgi:hypothetical protein
MIEQPSDYATTRLPGNGATQGLSAAPDPERTFSAGWAMPSANIRRALFRR